MKNEKRKFDLSSKLIQMGQVLISEGDDLKDDAISTTGVIMIFLGGILIEEGETINFSQLVSMYSAKKMIDYMENSGLPIFDMIKSRNSETTYDDLIDRLNKLKDGFDDESENDIVN